MSSDMALIEPHSTSPAGPARPLETAKYCVCDCCRIKKIKCDMVRPTCGSCRLRRANCTYSKRRAKPGPPRRGPPANRAASKSTARFSRFENIQELSFVGPVSPMPFEWAMGIDDLGDDRASPWADLPLLPHTPLLERPLNGYLDLDPETENYLFNLYFRHVQPIYPLFRKQTTAGLSEMPDRLKLAMFAVASRFATPCARRKSLLSPAEFARRAKGPDCTQRDYLCIDEIKTSLLLCVHNLAESVNWDSVAEIAKLARMADIYHALHVDEMTGGATVERDAEEWRSVWWTIYSLDTFGSAIAALPHSTATHLQEYMELPTVSVSDFTNSHPDSSSPRPESHDLQLLPSLAMKHWEIMQTIFREPSCRSRNMYLGVSSLMRAVTELRLLARYDRGPAFYTRLCNLESDCAAMTFALPSWACSPARNFDIEETAEEHRNRLTTLLVFCCARLLLKITAAQVSGCGAPQGAQESEKRRPWQAILSEANEVVSVLQYWKPNYFEAADPMCSYIVFLAASVLVLNCKAEFTFSTPLSSEHVDLFILFLDQIGQYWPIGKHLKGLLNVIQVLPAKQPYREILQRIFQITSPLHGALMRSGVFEDRDMTTPKDNVEPTTRTMPLLGDINLYEDRARQMGLNMNFDDFNNAWLHDSDFGYSGITAAELDDILGQG